MSVQSFLSLVFIIFHFFRFCVSVYKEGVYFSESAKGPFLAGGWGLAPLLVPGWEAVCLPFPLNVTVPSGGSAGSRAVRLTGQRWTCSFCLLCGNLAGGRKGAHSPSCWELFAKCRGGGSSRCSVLARGADGSSRLLWGGGNGRFPGDAIKIYL